MKQKFLLIILNIWLVSLVQGQDLISQLEKKKVINKVSKQLSKRYILKEEGVEMSKIIQRNYENGEYDTISSKFTFSERLTSDMRSIFPDKHLALIYKPWAQMKRDSVKAAQTLSKTQVLEASILPSNIGYLTVTSFNFKLSDWDNAMYKLSESDAILIDVRNNRGGSGNQVNYAMSYFLLGGLHFATSYNWKGKEYKGFIKEKINGERKTEIPLIILIDKNTFSAAEAFAYLLQSLERAIIVGETSGGGSHQKINFNINKSFYLSLPIIRGESAITKTNWEGTGVIPNVETSTTAAFDTGIETATKLIRIHNKR